MPGAARMAWESAQVAGAIATVLALLLCCLPVRPRSGSIRTLAPATHERLGILACLGLLLHVPLLIASDPLVLEHLRPSLPLYELAGVLAAVLLLLLGLPAQARLRNWLWPRHRAFQAWHLASACLLPPLLAAHVVGTGRYVHGPYAAALAVAAAAAGFASLLRARAAAGLARAWPFGRMADMAHGPSSRLVLGLSAAGLALLLALPWRPTATLLRESPVPRVAALAVDFPHGKHATIACVACHHEFVRPSGTGTCYGCHRSDRPDLPRGAEALFHAFCLGCHRDPPAAGARHGPVTGCLSCHAPRRH